MAIGPLLMWLTTIGGTGLGAVDIHGRWTDPQRRAETDAALIAGGKWAQENLPDAFNNTVGITDENLNALQQDRQKHLQETALQRQKTDQALASSPSAVKSPSPDDRISTDFNQTTADTTEPPAKNTPSSSTPSEHPSADDLGWVDQIIYGILCFFEMEKMCKIQFDKAAGEYELAFNPSSSFKFDFPDLNPFS